MKPSLSNCIAFSVLLITGSELLGCKTDTKSPPGKVSYAAQVRPQSESKIVENPLNNAYFGDLHLHTRNSFDAYIFNVRATPDEAYRFAKGEPLTHSGGFNMQLRSGPLDFLAVTDHAEYLGVLPAIDTPGTQYAKVPYAKHLFASDRASVINAFSRFAKSMSTGQIIEELSDMSATRSAWQETISSAQHHNNPGTFTTFIGYEFTSLPQVRNLHRNVIFASENVPAMPFSALDSQNPEDLWDWLDKERSKGRDALAIPHNSNGSDGTMFEQKTWSGDPIGVDYAKQRARNEPLVEIIQIKGQSETMPLLSPNDEWAGFELMTSYIGTVKPITQFAGGYVRDALKTGLKINAAVGHNPYAMGFVAGTDSHNGGGTAEEFNHFSKVGVLDSSPKQRGSVVPNPYTSWEQAYAAGYIPPLSSTWNSGGLTGVWAKANTRDAIYSALKRKETFATSGPRIKVRFFAGYAFDTSSFTSEQGLKNAYQNGVAMGGELPSKPTSPEFLVAAIQDSHSAPLQRIQMIKGWLDKQGHPQERVYDIACADNLEPDPQTHRCPDNNASVDIKTCDYDRTTGASELHTRWYDPDYHDDSHAFYYVRVLENPTCRWSTWDAIRAGSEPNPRLPITIQERAYTSPIWLLPTS
ncbi:DUF3604 domain-containing protein [Alteromonas sp. D210916BOD_24]|uniref:DUF3604 domain-containing protein n=1 Tax=Alteromonas sp. D210916BOD_24 TaxID=3157618 RepID=UPI00399D1CD2